MQSLKVCLLELRDSLIESDEGNEYRRQRARLHSNTREIYRLEYMLDQLKRGREAFDRKGRQLGFHASKFIAQGQHRLVMLLDETTELMLDALKEHWLWVEKTDEKSISRWESGFGPDAWFRAQEKKMRGAAKDRDPERLSTEILAAISLGLLGDEFGVLAGTANDMFAGWHRRRPKLKQRALDAFKKLRPHEREAIAAETNRDETYSLEHMKPALRMMRAIKQKANVPRTTIGEKLQFFHLLLNVVHERGKVFGSTFYDADLEQFDALSAGPDPSWDADVKRLLQREGRGRGGRVI